MAEEKETLKERFDEFKDREHEKHEERKAEKAEAQRHEEDRIQKEEELDPGRVVDMENKIAVADEYAFQRE